MSVNPNVDKQNQDMGLPEEVMRDLMGEIGCNPIIAECQAKCCTNILLLSDKEIARIRNYIGRNGIKPINHHNIFSTEYVDICPFRGGEDEQYKCRIYECRPEICRHFECNAYLKKKPNMPNYRNKRPINMLLTFAPGSYCPNAPDLIEVDKTFKQKKKMVYGNQK